MRLLLTLFIAALTASCASTNSVPSDFRFAPDSAQGLVVGSITYDSGMGVYGIDGSGRNGSSTFRAQTGYALWPPLGPEFDPALKKKGGTFAVSVAPGQYTLQRWNIMQGQRIYAAKHPLDLTFNVAPGQVTYLGSLHFDADGEVTLEDRSERDLPILRSRLPAIGNGVPAYTLRAGTKVEHIGNEPAARGAAPLYVATAAAPIAGSPSASATKVAAFDPATMASVVDSTRTDGGPYSGTQFFVVAAIDGKKIERSAETVSRQASRGTGMTMRVVDIERPVAAGKVGLRLRGLIDRAAPIQQIFAAAVSGGTREVEGDVEVELKADARYRVNGRIDEYRSQVWLEDDTGNELPGTRVVGAPTAEATKAAAAELRYTCCNFHPDTDGWISDANWIEQQPMVPAGTPIRVYEYGSNRAKAQIDGRAMWLGLDYGRAQQTTQQLVARLAVRDDPTARIRGYPEAVQAAIRAGRVMTGMTKEQAIVTLGYPRTDLTRSLDLPRWSYRTLSDVEFVLVWGADGLLASVEAAPDVRALVMQAR
jgi:hypothetical protein